MNQFFDASQFTTPKAKPLPVILLLDVSGSMASKNKMQKLNEEVRKMLHDFKEVEGGEREVSVAIITFGAEVKLHQPMASAQTIQWTDLSANGGTPMGTALNMAKSMVEDKTIIPSRAYRPVVVLASDGEPTDSWQAPLNAFIKEGRSSKCDRFSIAIGADSDTQLQVLKEFIAGTGRDVLYAGSPGKLSECFNYITMTVTTRTRSQKPDATPSAAEIGMTPPTYEQLTRRGAMEEEVW